MQPSVYISSAFYDLKHIRNELCTFIESQKYDLRFFSSADLDITCYAAMKYSDMVIFIIGGKYQAESEFDLSAAQIKNEFLKLKEYNIPVYIFVDNNVYYDFEIYERNRSCCKAMENISFNSTDNINIFRFIREIQKSGFSLLRFTDINDIKSTLIEQWSDIMKKYLIMLRKT